MAIEHASPEVTVGTTATSLTGGVTDAGGVTGHRAQEVGRTILLSENSGTIYLGGPDVTTTAYGYKLEAGAPPFSMDLVGSDELYAVAAAPVTVRVLHAGV